MPSPLETPALSVSEIPVLPALLMTVNGVPDWNIVTPEISQASRTLFRNPEQQFPFAAVVSCDSLS